MLVSPLLSSTRRPLMIVGSSPSVANKNKKPTAVNTLPSITPVGGAKNPAIISPIAADKHAQNTIVCALMLTIRQNTNQGKLLNYELSKM